MKAERRLADCGGETLFRLVADEARGSPGAPEARLQARRRNQGALREVLQHPTAFAELELETLIPTLQISSL